MSVTFRNCEWKNCCKSFQATRKDQAHCTKSCQTQDARWKRNAEKRKARIKKQLASRKTLNRYSLTESVVVGEVIGKTKGQQIQVQETTARLSSLPVKEYYKEPVIPRSKIDLTANIVKPTKELVVVS